MNYLSLLFLFLSQFNQPVSMNQELVINQYNYVTWNQIENYVASSKNHVAFTISVDSFLREFKIELIRAGLDSNEVGMNSPKIVVNRWQVTSPFFSFSNPAESYFASSEERGEEILSRMELKFCALYNGIKYYFFWFYTIVTEDPQGDYIISDRGYHFILMVKEKI